MEEISLRPMTPADRWEVAELICISTNMWYQTHGRPPVFAGGPEATVVFFDVYESLDPGCGVVAVSAITGRLAGSCFYHPRPTHVSLGIMNVHPNHFGAGVARQLLRHIIAYADRQQKPLRLVSSALNLDSFSLYTRAGFVPQTPYQDMYVSVPADGLTIRPEGHSRVREATLDDLPDMVALEMTVAGLGREKDYRYFIENRDGFWHVSVSRNEQGELEGFLCSCGHARFNMVGPGTASSPEPMIALLAAELDCYRGRTPVFVVPSQCMPLVAEMYRWGAKNCEMHISQVRGAAQPLRGVHLPTFLPESS